MGAYCKTYVMNKINSELASVSPDQILNPDQFLIGKSHFLTPETNLSTCCY